MSVISRRAALSTLGAGVAAVAGIATYRYRTTGADSSAAAAPTNAVGSPVGVENLHAGSAGWKVSPKGRLTTKDTAGQIWGYASATSVAHGEPLSFHVSVRDPQPLRIEVFRLGHYGDEGGRLMVSSPAIEGSRRAAPKPHPETGAIVCDWPVSWSHRIPDDWVSGVYLAVFRAKDGHRSCTPFVVRDTGRSSDLLVVLPFTTYQAYNRWPLDGRTGKNLYRGYVRPDGPTDPRHRASHVSFDRPYSDHGMPTWFELDVALTRWVEHNGYDVTYASSIDLHEGRVDPERYTAMIFPGHDEYWSRPMRDVAEKAVSVGTHLAFLASNNIYFHIRLTEGPDGTPARTVVCHKTEDPQADRNGPTVRWRDLKDGNGKAGARAEQGLLGVQYNGILSKPAPLVVREADHWFWTGTGLRDGQEIPGLVGVEADGYDKRMPAPEGATRTLLSASPYKDKLGRGRGVQNTGLCEHQDGTLVFVAGTFFWPLALQDPSHYDARIERATRNLIERMLSHDR